MSTPTPELIKPVYEWHTRVATYDVGPDRLLTPSAQLRLQQEAGELHFGEGGLHFQGVAACGLAFVVAQNNAVITRRPEVGERIVLKTWSKGVQGAKFLRSYRFEDENGNVLIDSTASFVLVDVENHTLLRPSQFPFHVKHNEETQNDCPLPPRLRMPAEAIPSGTHTVRFSELDFNGHLNNTRYADIVFDALSADKAANLKEFSVAFVKEAKLHDTLTLTTAEEDGYTFLQATKEDGTVCFTARVK